MDSKSKPKIDMGEKENRNNWKVPMKKYENDIWITYIYVNN